MNFNNYFDEDEDDAIGFREYITGKNKQELKIDDFISSSYQTALDMLKKGIDINTCNENGQNALFYCDEVQKAELLISKGIKINHKDKDGRNALYNANELVSDYLIKNGINVNNIDKKGENALFKNRLSLKKAELLLNSGININLINKEGYNALYNAEIDIFKFLITKGINIHLIDKDNRNYLFYFKDEERLLSLIENGINVRHTDNYNQTFIFNRCKHPIVIYKAIKKGLDVNTININNENALFDYSNLNSFCHSDKINLLISMGINTHLINNKGENFLFTLKKGSLLKYVLNRFDDNKKQHLISFAEVNLLNKNKHNLFAEVANNMSIRNSEKNGIYHILAERGCNPDIKLNEGVCLKELLPERVFKEAMQNYIKFEKEEIFSDIDGNNIKQHNKKRL